MKNCGWFLMNFLRMKGDEKKLDMKQFSLKKSFSIMIEAEMKNKKIPNKARKIKNI
jgi:hypothetical protein